MPSTGVMDRPTTSGPHGLKAPARVRSATRGHRWAVGVDRSRRSRRPAAVPGTAWPERSYKSAQPSARLTCLPSCSAVAAGDVAADSVGGEVHRICRMGCDGVRASPRLGHERGVRLDLHQVEGLSGSRRVVLALVGLGGGGRVNAVSELPAGAEALTGHRGHGMPGLTVTGVVRKHREGLEQGKQRATDSWLPTGRMKGRAPTSPREVKIRNDVPRSRRSAAGRPDAVGV